MDIPFISADVPDAPSQAGVGDVGLRFNYRFANTTSRSSLLGAAVRLDTASNDALGDDTTQITGFLVNSWRRQAWILSAAASAT